jgi:hypothetical protein
VNRCRCPNKENEELEGSKKSADSETASDLWDSSSLCAADDNPFESEYEPEVEREELSDEPSEEPEQDSYVTASKE